MERGFIPTIKAYYDILTGRPEPFIVSVGVRSRRSCLPNSFLILRGGRGKNAVCYLRRSLAHPVSVRQIKPRALHGKCQNQGNKEFSISYKYKSVTLRLKGTVNVSIHFERIISAGTLPREP